MQLALVRLSWHSSCDSSEASSTVCKQAFALTRVAETEENLQAVSLSVSGTHTCSHRCMCCCTCASWVACGGTVSLVLCLWYKPEQGRGHPWGHCPASYPVAESLQTCIMSQDVISAFGTCHGCCCCGAVIHRDVCAKHTTSCLWLATVSPTPLGCQSRTVSAPCSAASNDWLQASTVACANVICIG